MVAKHMGNKDWIIFKFCIVLVFSSNRQLTSIDMSHNGMISFNSSLFRNTTNLATLKLNDNQLGNAFSDPRLNYARKSCSLPLLYIITIIY